MSWQNRTRQAAYTDHEDIRYVFEYTSLARNTNKRTTAFSFPGINDTYVQDNGYGSRQYAMRCIFWGENHDILATEFEAALLKPGVGKLEHPLYGTFNVVPFGRISRRDDLVGAAGQSIVDVTFWTTTEVVYPTSQKSPKNEVRANIEDFTFAAPVDYAQTMEVENFQRSQELRGKVEETLSDANDILSVPASTLEDVSREFNAWQVTIQAGLAVLVGNPTLLAQQTVNLLLAPARAVTGIQNTLLAYVNFLRRTFSRKTAQPWLQVCSCSNPGRQVSMANDFRTADLNAQAALVAMALASIEATFRTKPEALSAADTLLSEMAAVAAWREQGYGALAQTKYGARLEATDLGIMWLETTKTVTLCAGYLVQISFTLAAERVTVLDRPRTVLDLAAELYGGTDEYLDFLIDSNDLTGSEILELPRGAEIVWYPG